LDLVLKDSSTVGPLEEVGVYDSGEVVTERVLVDYCLDFDRRKLGRHGMATISPSDAMRAGQTPASSTRTSRSSTGSAQRVVRTRFRNPR
jgi:hypothetical protein